MGILKKLLFVSGIQVLVSFTIPSGLRAEAVSYIHTDQLGSVSLVTDQTGEVVAQQSYYPYGNTRSYQLSVDSYQLGERQYTGQISDQNQTGLYYYNARYYNPTLAKFTQADTVNDQLNRYAYVGNNPVNLVDPSGHDAGLKGTGGYEDPSDSGGYEDEGTEPKEPSFAEKYVRAAKTTSQVLNPMNPYSDYYSKESATAFWLGQLAAMSISFSPLVIPTAPAAASACAADSGGDCWTQEAQKLMQRAKTVLPPDSFAPENFKVVNWIRMFMKNSRGGEGNNGVSLLRRFVQHGEELINQGKFREAIDHFTNQSFARFYNTFSYDNNGGDSVFRYATRELPYFVLKTTGKYSYRYASAYLTSWKYLLKWWETWAGTVTLIDPRTAEAIEHINWLIR